MPANVTLSAGTLYGFLLVLARVGGALIFVPLPGIKGAPEPARVALALGFTLALFGRWPVVGCRRMSPWRCWPGGLLAEAAVGIAIGVSVAIVLEAFTLAAQVLGLAGRLCVRFHHRSQLRKPIPASCWSSRN